MDCRVFITVGGLLEENEVFSRLTCLGRLKQWPAGPSRRAVLVWGVRRGNSSKRSAWEGGAWVRMGAQTTCSKIRPSISFCGHVFRVPVSSLGSLSFASLACSLHARDRGTVGSSARILILYILIPTVAEMTARRFIQGGRGFAGRHRQSAYLGLSNGHGGLCSRSAFLFVSAGPRAPGRRPLGCEFDGRGLPEDVERHQRWRLPHSTSALSTGHGAFGRLRE